MKHKLILLSLLLPYLATSQVAKDTVTVLTIAQIPAGAIRDTTNFTFVQDNAFRKQTFDSLAKYTRVKLIGDRGDITVSGATGLTWELDAGVVDSMQLSAGAVVLPGAKVTGTLPVNKGGTGQNTLALNKVLVGNGTSGVLQPTNLHWNNSQNRLGIGTALPTYRVVSEDTSSGFRYAALQTVLDSGKWVGFLYGYTGAIYQKAATIYESVDNSARGKFHIALNNTTGAGNNASIADARLTVLANGNVGIGTTSPGARLDIAGGSLNVPATSGVTLGTAASFYHTTGDANGDFLLGTNFGAFRFFAGNVEYMRLTGAGNLGIGTISPTAALHLKAGTATASTAPLKFTSGTNLTTAEAGAMEFNGSNLFFTPSTVRQTINQGLTGSATLDFPNTNAQSSSDLTITVTNASDGDVVSLGVPNASVNANICYTAWVSGSNTVTVRFNNYSSGAINPASGTFKVFVTKF